MPGKSASVTHSTPGGVDKNAVVFAMDTLLVSRRRVSIDQ
jgi:hypothetical protein